MLVMLTASSVCAQTSGDAFYRARHPHLLFTTADLPALRARVTGGGAEEAAYTFIRSQMDSVYATAPFDSLIRNDFAQEQIINIGLAAYLPDTLDSVAVDLGKRLTQYIARTWDVDTDAYASSLRLRALAIGYDLYFGVATPQEREEIQAEAASYITYMTTDINYDIWLHSPYVSNKTAMVASALGEAGIAFHDELGDSLAGAAIAKADTFYAAWQANLLGNDGCYREGALYALWSLRNLIYYFEARRRFDGFDYSNEPALQHVQQWLAYELDPRGDARLNNIQDLTDYYRPLARHGTYFDWALARWASPLAAYLWSHAEGTYGRDMGDDADKAAIIFWHRDDITPVNPSVSLPDSWLSPSRGLYYYRSGWPNGIISGAVVFSFYSGQFRGGHAQEDQNQFTLAAFGQKLIVDHGAGSTAARSAAHNLIFIDGKGEHYAGGSIGTDGRITEYVSSDFVDYVCGDATEAYTTHSPYNDTGVPYSWSDWTWGDTGSNPVQRALRRILVVHDPGELTYFFIQDDICKDGLVHQYDWHLHVPATAAIDSSAEPVVVTVSNADLDIYQVNPPDSTTSFGAAPFDNGSQDPNSIRLTVTANTVDPAFGFLLMPRPATQSRPTVATTPAPGGTATVVRWPQGVQDLIYARTTWTAPEPLSSFSVSAEVATDAGLMLVRTTNGAISRYLAVDATTFASGGITLVQVNDGPLTVAYDGNTVQIDRSDADFRIYAPTATDVFADGARVPTIRDGDYLTSALTTSAGRTPPGGAPSLSAYPNPFNPEVRISFVLPARARVAIDLFDVAGRHIRNLLAGERDAGPHVLDWDGREDGGQRAASGVYFARLRTGSAARTIKLVLLR